jgi:hypothetical protein
MGNINIGRVVVGGLLAGLVLNIGEVILNDVVFGAYMKEFLARHNFAEPGTNFIVVAVGLTFVMGIVLVLGYACIRTRLGPGPKTAIIAGLFAWFGAYFYAGIINHVIYGTPTATIATVVALGLVLYVVAALAGAWVYKEA